MLLLCQHPDSIAEVKRLVKEMKFDELRDTMMSPLSFGTAGNLCMFVLARENKGTEREIPV